jgi:23S rRNA pseudouridine1911/1915/1917 synthase
LKRLSLVVGKGDAGERLDRFIAARGGISRGVARRALDAGGVFLDDRRCKVASRLLRDGQRVVVNLAEGGQAPEPPPPLEAGRLLYADDHVAAVDKPAGVPAQPTLVSDRGTLPELAAALVGGPVALVHRLDRETTGVTLFARTSVAATALSEAFRDAAIDKSYLALCVRAPEPPDGRIEAPLGKDTQRPGLRAVVPWGEPAATRYRTLASSHAALVEAHPETGRTHQIRAHLAHLGAPLLGDVRYGGPRRVGAVVIPRIMLHALRIRLAHPTTGLPLIVEAPIPRDFLAVQRALVGETL